MRNLTFHFNPIVKNYKSYIYNAGDSYQHGLCHNHSTSEPHRRKAQSTIEDCSPATLKIVNFFIPIFKCNSAEFAISSALDRIRFEPPQLNHRVFISTWVFYWLQDVNVQAKCGAVTATRNLLLPIRLLFSNAASWGHHSHQALPHIISIIFVVSRDEIDVNFCRARDAVGIAFAHQNLKSEAMVIISEWWVLFSFSECRTITSRGSRLKARLQDVSRSSSKFLLTFPLPSDSTTFCLQPVKMPYNGDGVTAARNALQTHRRIVALTPCQRVFHAMFNLFHAQLEFVNDCQMTEEKVLVAQPYTYCNSFHC